MTKTLFVERKEWTARGWAMQSSVQAKLSCTHEFQLLTQHSDLVDLAWRAFLWRYCAPEGDLLLEMMVYNRLSLLSEHPACYALSSFVCLLLALLFSYLRTAKPGEMEVVFLCKHLFTFLNLVTVCWTVEFCWIHCEDLSCSSYKQKRSNHLFWCRTNFNRGSRRMREPSRSLEQQHFDIAKILFSWFCKNTVLSNVSLIHLVRLQLETILSRWELTKNLDLIPSST